MRDPKFAYYNVGTWVSENVELLCWTSNWEPMCRRCYLVQWSSVIIFNIAIIWMLKVLNLPLPRCRLDRSLPRPCTRITCILHIFQHMWFNYISNVKVYCPTYSSWTPSRSFQSVVGAREVRDPCEKFDITTKSIYHFKWLSIIKNQSASIKWWGSLFWNEEVIITIRSEIQVISDNKNCIPWNPAWSWSNSETCGTCI